MIQNTYKNEWTEQWEKKISKLDSLKLFMQKKYVSLELLAVLLLWVWAITTTTTTTNSSGTLPDKKDADTIQQDSLKTAQLDSVTHVKLVEFGHFLKKQSLWKIDKSTTLWRYVRIMRYRDQIEAAAKEYDIPFEYFFALIMVESEGNTASINETDGWAGFIHFQPDVAKQFGLKVFTDDPKYKQYDVATMKKQWKTLHEIYKIHGKLLKNIIKNKWMAELEKLDGRFNIWDCIEITAKYLHQIKENNVDKHKDETCKDASWNVYKNDTIFDFDWMLALNGFNKWPTHFDVNFKKGNHVKNIKMNLTDMRKYEIYVKNMIHQGKSDQEIFDGLQTTKFI